MGKRRELQEHLRQLGDMREIMESMKALAYMETRKLGQFLQAQRQTLAAIETAVADFLQFHPRLRSAAALPPRACLVIGSERGFCGDFNEVLLRALPADPDLTVIGVGQKLNNLLRGDPRRSYAIDGADAAEEVDAVLTRISGALGTLPGRPGGIFTLDVICHDAGTEAVVTRRLLPPFADLPAAPVHGYPPRLQLAPEDLFARLVDRHLLAALNAMLYTSLLIENNRRVQHLSTAVQHLVDKTGVLSLRNNALRQEEITEEIEVILLSSAGRRPDFTV